MAIIIYVDDIILIRNDIYEMAMVKEKLHINIEIKDLDPLNDFLIQRLSNQRMESLFPNKNIFQKTLMKLNAKLRLSGYKLADTLMQLNAKLLEKGEVCRHHTVLKIGK